jgi:hypothetical protein
VDPPLAVEVGEILPHALPEQETIQLTPFPDESPLTVAAIGLPWAACTMAEVGDTCTWMGGADEPPLHPKLPIVSSTLSKSRQKGMRLSDFRSTSQMGNVCPHSTFFSDMGVRSLFVEGFFYRVFSTHVLIKV